MKKILSVVSAILVLALIMNVPVLAESEYYLGDTQVDETRGDACDCGGRIFVTYTYGTAYRTGQVYCVHFPYGVDVLWARGVTVTGKCNKCASGYSYYYVETLDSECRGFY